MCKEIGLRFRSGLNWLLLCFNVLLLVFLVFHWLLPLDRAVAEARKVAAILGMDVYCVRSPLAILVDKDFPGTDKFTLFHFGQPLIVSTTEDKAADGKDVESLREVCVALGADFSMTCVYSLVDGIHVRELVLFKKDETLFDLNADGVFDLRQPRDPNKKFEEKIPEIWYKGKWEKVVSSGFKGRYGKDGRRLVDSGETVSFDMKSGLWLSPTDKSSHDSEKGTTSP